MKQVVVAGSVLSLLTLAGLVAASPGPDDRRAALVRLRSEAGSAARIREHPLTGTAGFVSLPAGAIATRGATSRARAYDFLSVHGSAFGVTDASQQLAAAEQRIGPYGHEVLIHRQLHRGIPVFGAELRIHFDPSGRLIAVNGTFLPGVDLETEPTITDQQAEAIAVRAVRTSRKVSPDGALAGHKRRLVIYRPGLATRTPGRPHLAWEIDVRAGMEVREFVFVDARDGAVIDRLPGIRETVQRRIHEPDFLSNVIWAEGDALPYSTGDAANDEQVNTLIEQAGEVYDLFVNLSGGTHPSWDSMSGTFETVWKASFLVCPNAFWNGTLTAFCEGLAADDVVAHEWIHAFTESNHDLIYLAQPGALNEAYSDIFGELVDLTNGVGSDAPSTARTAGACSTFGGVPAPSFEVLSPAGLAGFYAAGGATFNPSGSLSVTAGLELVNDGVNNGGATSVTDGCEPLVGFTPGRIAIADRGGCAFTTKTIQAQNAGAVALIMVNTANTTFVMTGSPDGISIPSITVASADGALLKAEPAGTVSATIEVDEPTDSTLRWLIGEDATATGPLRDMWNPNCFGHPGRVSDPQYWCGLGDNGGVHVNSGIPNHAFALLVDGGTYNGNSVTPIGPTKAAHLYWRAMTAYQVPDSDFADHADALAQSCSDLLGIDLADLDTGAPSGEILDASDCQQVTLALAAVETGQEPECLFAPLLAPGPPTLACGNLAFSDDFESDPAGTWVFANEGVFPEYQPRDWVWTPSVPDGGTGAALFAVDNRHLGDCQPKDQSGRMTADSPPILLDGPPFLVFDHYVATELGLDGGNVKVSVNGGPFVSLSPGDFVFNLYNTVLAPPSPQNFNPLAGELAFSGADGGSVEGSWGRSIVSLAGPANPGDTIRLRFDFGVDGCSGLDGWYVDNVGVCTDATLPGQAAHFVQVNDPSNPILADSASGYAGAAWVDYDGDDDLDLSVNTNLLYRNDGDRTFVKVFTDIGSGIVPSTGRGTTWGDYDNDGDTDVYIASAQSYLYRNDGNDTFTRILDGIIGDGSANRGWSPAWADYDRDGNLDLAVTHPATFVPGPPLTNHLFRGSGPPDFGFTKITDQGIVIGLDSFTVGTWSDYDVDGDLDYFIGTGPADGTLQRDRLWRNLLQETGAADFEKILTQPIASDLQDGQIWNWIDYDNDGDLDAYLTNWGGAFGGMVNRLYRNDGGVYTSVDTGNIVTDVNISLASVWGDFDNDGDLDCFVANDLSQQDRYYSNNGDGTFSSLSNGLALFLTHRGATAGDFDGDGDLDLYADGPNVNRRLLQNATANGNHWLQLRLHGVISNRSAIGAKVWTRATIGGNEARQLREVSAQNSFNGHNSLEVHFGLGDATQVDDVTVEWPSGLQQTLFAVAADALIDVEEVVSVYRVSDGATVSGEPMRASRSGDDVLIQWDASQCISAAVNIYRGTLGAFTTVRDGTCDSPDDGSALVDVPGDSWFLVVRTDGVSADGSWGRDGQGAERELTGVSAACPAAIQHVIDPTCP